MRSAQQTCMRGARLGRDHTQYGAGFQRSGAQVLGFDTPTGSENKAHAVVLQCLHSPEHQTTRAATIAPGVALRPQRRSAEAVAQQRSESGAAYEARQSLGHLRQRQAALGDLLGWLGSAAQERVHRRLHVAGARVHRILHLLHHSLWVEVPQRARATDSDAADDARVEHDVLRVLDEIAADEASHTTHSRPLHHRVGAHLLELLLQPSGCLLLLSRSRCA
mmetsp:Transcript_5099/g.9957  ORF Transcript_5099/g.9957 Transcript_5099/m.9957 type:complete len:221 (+) Transcript_5099:153-815(+)